MQLFDKLAEVGPETLSSLSWCHGSFSRLLIIAIIRNFLVTSGVFVTFGPLTTVIRAVISLFLAIVWNGSWFGEFRGLIVASFHGGGA